MDAMRAKLEAEQERFGSQCVHEQPHLGSGLRTGACLT